MSELAEIIKNNPGCKFLLDNDMFWVFSKDSDWDSVEELYMAYSLPERDLLLALAEVIGSEVNHV